jgi:Tfp pilus assembly protein PilO
MPSNFSLKSLRRKAQGPVSWLRNVAIVLGALNLVAIYLLLVPPGGTRSELETQSQEMQQKIASSRMQSTRLKRVAAQAQIGSEQATDFESKYILQKRTAYERLITELQRITKASGMQARDAVYTEEPIEGTADLTLLSSSANYEGSYEDLRRFLLALDHSPVLVMLENLTATPEQKGNRISASMRFQTIMREEGSTPAPQRGEP